jgi:hypothetical protein
VIISGRFFLASGTGGSSTIGTAVYNPATTQGQHYQDASYVCHTRSDAIACRMGEG